MGKRDQATTDVFVEGIRHATSRSRFQITTDGFAPYKSAMFLTRKLWGIANQHPFMHHGQFTTMRQAVLAHAGEALTSRTAFQALASYDQNSIIEFLKSLQIFTNQVGSLCEDEDGEGIDCPAGIDP